MDNPQTPTFLGIGPYKTATTWMHTFLEKHPEIMLPEKKEINFFSFNYDKGWDWYLGHYPDQQQIKSAVGDISPSYFSSELAPSRIAERLPGVKILVILRNPVDRAYSHYCMDLRLGKTSPQIDSEIFQFIEDGLYYKHLKRYFSVLPDKQFFVALYDELVENSALFIRQIYDFLGVAADFIPDDINTRVYAKKPLPRYGWVYEKIYRAFRDAQKRRKNPLIPLQGKQWMVNNMHKILPKTDYPEFTPLIKTEIAKLYHDDIAELSNWLGKDCNHWLEPYL